MKKMIILSVALIFPFFAACAEYQEDDGSCEIDCDDPGTEDPACETDCDVDNTDDWAVRPDGADGLAFNAAYCPGIGGTAYLVGNCPSEGIHGNWDPSSSASYNQVLVKAEDGWYYFGLEGDVASCVVTLAGCNATSPTCSGGDTWANYGCPGSSVGPGTHKAGPYVQCSYNHQGIVESCWIEFVRDPGKAVTPGGELPTGP